MLSLPEGWDYTTKGPCPYLQKMAWTVSAPGCGAGGTGLYDPGACPERQRQLRAIEYTILEQPGSRNLNGKNLDGKIQVQANPVLDNPVLGKT